MQTLLKFQQEKKTKGEDRLDNSSFVHYVNTN